MVRAGAGATAARFRAPGMDDGHAKHVLMAPAAGEGLLPRSPSGEDGAPGAARADPSQPARP